MIPAAVIAAASCGGVHAVVTDATTVLDAVHARGDALLHPRERVRGDGEPEPVRLIDHGSEFRLAELAGPDAGGRRARGPPAAA